LINLGGLEIYAELMAILASLPRLDRPRALALAEAAAQRNASERFELLLNLIDIAMARLAQTGAHGTPPLPEAANGEGQTLMRLAPSPESARRWATVAAEIIQRSRQGKAVNLDPASLVLDTVFRMQDVSSGR
jgi:DNA polymerase-3 subunit delta'